MYFGDLKRVELSFSSFGESMLFVKPVLRAFQAPTVGELIPSLLALSNDLPGL